MVDQGSNHGHGNDLQVHSYPDLLANPESTWTYRGEGNANIVFSGRIVSPAIRDQLGTSHLILRVAKRPVRTGSHQHQLANGKDQSQPQFALNTVRFITQVINPLFPDRFLPRMLAVQVTPAFLQALDSSSTSWRPAARTAKGAIDTTQSVALLSPDYALMDLGTGADAVDTLCLEIKPKWLFVPRRHRPRRDPPAHAHAHAPAAACTRPNRAPTPTPTPTPSPSSSPSPPPPDVPAACRFCAHQRYKLATDPGYAHVSGFCPLDLLSHATICDAVRALLDAPGNNLRVWMNGERTAAPRADTRVFGGDEGEGGAASSLESVLGEVLAQLVPLFLALGEHQERLDDVADSRDVHDAYARVCRDEQGSDDEGLGLDTWAKVVQTYLGRRGSRCARQSAGDGDNGDNGTAAADALQLVAEFLLSMTLKDCSVLITVAPWAQETLPGELVDQGLSVVSFAGKAWVYRATLLDLDPKQMAKVPEWLRLDREIRDHFVASVTGNNVEVNGVGKQGY